MKSLHLGVSVAPLFFDVVPAWTKVSLKLGSGVHTTGVAPVALLLLLLGVETTKQINLLKTVPIKFIF